MNKTEVLDILSSEKYYTPNDLRYNAVDGFLFSKEKLAEFLTTKDTLIEMGEEDFVKVPLKTFNSKYLFYFNGNYLKSAYKEYALTIIRDFNAKSNSLILRNEQDILTSRIFSEIEGTLNIENVPTTHKRIKQIVESDMLVDKNDIIIKNMSLAIDYVLSAPDFTKENLFKLYSILSKDCLAEEDKLKEGNYYRDDAVSVGGYEGVDFNLIDDYMNGLFELVNNKAEAKKFGLYLPHICHYYILYLHPYFDYNGRTARMVSLWISVLFNLKYTAPLFISEAINEYKQAYYESLVNTRNTNNDMTYFLGFIIETAIKFSLIYKNLEDCKDKLSKEGVFLTSTETIYLKKILIHNPENFFNYKMFMGYIGFGITKQRVLKILHQLAEYGIIEETANKKGETIFKINQSYITYKIPN